jgi:uncharacterized protein with HEPN domain
MSRHDDSITLRQMLDYVEEAVALAKDRTRADIKTDRVFFLALSKLVEIVGEAATRISDSMQAAQRKIVFIAFGVQKPVCRCGATTSATTSCVNAQVATCIS